MKLPLWRIAEFVAAGGEFDENAVARGYSIDSRTLSPGDFFIAVKGERLDGHDYVEAALARGAVGAIVAREQMARFAVKTRLLAVDDTLSALQALGAAVRRLWAKTVVAVTGSTGKTTTKEAVAHLLSTRFHVLKTEGNLNNQFGLPLSLLRLEPEHDIAVLELGMNHAGEIRGLAKIAQHDVAVVTNVGPVHLEFFGSVAEIARAKYELIETLHPGGTAVLNADDEYVSQFGRDFKGKIVTYGIRHPADVRAEAIEDRGAEGSRFEIVAGGCREKAALPLVGLHNVANTLAAVAVALERGISPSEAVAALATLAPLDKRGQLLEIGGATVINDCYNSNPRALGSMLDVLAGFRAGRRIAVLGEMLELGPAAPQLHAECGAHAAEKGIDLLVGVRGVAEHLVEGARKAGMKAEFVASPEQAGEWLAKNARPGDAVLLKASRGVRLEKALETWQAKLGAVTQRTQ